MRGSKLKMTDGMEEKGWDEQDEGGRRERERKRVGKSGEGEEDEERGVGNTKRQKETRKGKNKTAKSSKTLRQTDEIHTKINEVKAKQLNQNKANQQIKKTTKQQILKFATKCNHDNNSNVVFQKPTSSYKQMNCTTPHASPWEREREKKKLQLSWLNYRSEPPSRAVMKADVNLTNADEALWGIFVTMATQRGPKMPVTVHVFNLFWNRRHIDLLIPGLQNGEEFWNLFRYSFRVLIITVAGTWKA